MIIANSLKTIWRMKWKSSLMLLLIAAATAFTGLGISLFSACEALIARTESDFSTIAVFEYMGRDYPQNDVLDGEANSIHDSFSLGDGNSYVVSDNSPRLALGCISGYSRTYDTMERRYDAVIRIFVYSYDEFFNCFAARVPEQLYGSTDYTRKLTYLDTDSVDFVPELGHYYLVAGTFYSNATSYKYFRINDITKGALGESFVPWLDVTDAPTESNPAGSEPFYRAAELTEAINGIVTVRGTNDLNAIEEFHEGTLFLTSGDGFSESDYRDSAPVCIISEFAAKKLSLEVGDTLGLRIVPAGKTELYSELTELNSYPVTDFTVVGITNTVSDLESNIYIPDRSGVSGFFGYTVASVKLKNGTADEFLSAVGELPQRMNVSVYDYGYETVRDSLDLIRGRAVFLTLASVICTLAVLVLFGFIFVGKQKDTAVAMYSLGAGKGRIFAFLLIGACLILLLAVMIGTVGGYYLSGIAAEISENTVAEGESLNRLYSNSSLGLILPFEFDFSVPLGTLIPPAAAIFVFGAAMCVFFAAKTLEKPKRPKKKKEKVGVRPRSPHRSAGALSGVPAFVLASMKRGGFRTFAVPFVSAVMTVFLLLLSATASAYSAKLESLRSDSTIDGYMTSARNKAPYSIVAYADDLNRFCGTGQIESMSLSKRELYFYSGIRTKADGSEPDEPIYPVIPENAFARESYMNAFYRESPDIVYTNDLFCTEEFWFSSAIKTDFLEGYDINLFSGSESDVCMVSTAMAEEKGISLGDSVLFLETDEFNPVLLTVVGMFERQCGQNNIYVPLIKRFDTSVFTDEKEREIQEQLDEKYAEWLAQIGGSPKWYTSAYTEARTVDELLHKSTFDCVRFVLGSASRINPLKEQLAEAGFSMVRSPKTIRLYVVINDRDYFESEKKLNRQIEYLALLYPLMTFLASAVGFIVSYLIISGRRCELAVMRGLGARGSRVFFAFFSEQVILCIAGCLIGAAVFLPLTHGGLGALRPALWFLAAYIAGTALAVLILNRRKLLGLLSADD